MEKNQQRMEDGNTEAGIGLQLPTWSVPVRHQALPQHLPLLSVPTVPTRSQPSSCNGFFLFDLWSVSHSAWLVTLLKPGSDPTSLLLKLFQQLPWPQLQPCKQNCSKPTPTQFSSFTVLPFLSPGFLYVSHHNHV